MIEVPKVDDPEVLLEKLGVVGTVKLNLPLVTRSWLNELGLYVQLHYAAGQGRLQAGGKYRSYFDAWGTEGEATAHWEVRGYDRQTWNERFAHLVWPTYELALYIGAPVLWNTHVTLPRGQMAKLNELDDAAFLEVNKYRTSLVKQAIAHFRETREWSGLVQFRCQTCERRLNVWETQSKMCPYCKSTMLEATTL